MRIMTSREVERVSGAYVAEPSIPGFVAYLFNGFKIYDSGGWFYQF